MNTQSYASYVEDQLTCASPTDLIHLLYEGALEKVRSARLHLSAGDVMARGRALTKAFEFVSELIVSLDHEKGGQMSANLLRIYGYVQTRLLDAHRQQSDSVLAEVEAILTSLRDNWRGVEQLLWKSDPVGENR
jgi:flagellar protein FliS